MDETPRMRVEIWSALAPPRPRRASHRQTLFNFSRSGGLLEVEAENVEWGATALNEIAYMS